jgi:DtxR family transcriptional regulator, Mn-dependent transcriptional regulator
MASTRQRDKRDHAELTAAREDALKSIYALELQGGAPVSTTALAERLGVSPATASAMAKQLSEEDLASHTPYHGVSLTKQGRRAALEVMRHHRLLESFLAYLGMPWDRVHQEAEILEHVISEELEQLIARHLGNPTHDPHGDPIPSADLEITEEETTRLSDMAPGQRGTFVRVSDADPDMLRYLAELGVSPGDELEVTARQPFDGPITVRFANGKQTLGGALADAIRVGVSSR